jgi:hypothetical protein
MVKITRLILTRFQGLCLIVGFGFKFEIVYQNVEKILKCYLITKASELGFGYNQLI